MRSWMPHFVLASHGTRCFVKHDAVLQAATSDPEKKDRPHTPLFWDGYQVGGGASLARNTGARMCYCGMYETEIAGNARSRAVCREAHAAVDAALSGKIREHRRGAGLYFRPRSENRRGASLSRILEKQTAQCKNARTDRRIHQKAQPLHRNAEKSALSKAGRRNARYR